MYDAASGGTILRVSAADCELGRAEAHGRVQRRVVQRRRARDKPALGTVKIEADTKVAVDERLVNFSRCKITEANFPTLPKDQVREVIADIDTAIPDDERVIALDRVLASIDKSQIIPKNVDGVKADPPPIFFSKTPAVLVNLDGDPIWSPIKDNDLKFAVNTNWDLFQHAPTKTFYLRNNNTWLKAADVEGPVEAGGHAAGQLREAARRRQLEGREGEPARQDVAAAAVPKVFVSTQPARADPAHRRAELPAGRAGTGLLWVSNTESDVFRLGKTGPVYYLVAGRWFSAPDFTGPWTFATPTLPDDFKKIPLEHEPIARAGVGARHRPGGRSRAARADPADGARQQEGDRRRRRSRIQGDTPEFAADRDRPRCSAP